jgi:hypothetical protein
LLVLGRPEHLSSSTDTLLALKLNAIKKPLFSLKNVLQSLMKHFKGFGSGFTELHAKLDADTFLDFAIHHRHNETRG